MKQLKQETKINLIEGPINLCLIKEKDKNHVELKKGVLCYYTLLFSAWNWMQDFWTYKNEKLCELALPEVKMLK
jgi:hypothetical protein